MEIVSVKIGSPSQATKVNIEAPEQVKVTFKDVVVNNGGGSVKSVNGQTGDVLLDAAAVGALPNTTKIPAKTSDLINNSRFITKTVSDLTNYYLKSETYSREKIDNKISAIPKFNIKVVTSLPTTEIRDTTVYLVKSGDDSSNLYTEYIYVHGKWEILGSQTIDLSGYALKSEIPTDYAKQTEVSQLSEDIDMLIDSHVLNGEEKTLTVGVDIQVGQVINFKYLAGYGYTIKYRQSGILLPKVQVTGVSGSGNKYHEASMTVEDVESYTFIGVYADVHASDYATKEEVGQLSEEIVDLEENKANITDVKAWIIQQTPLFAESEEWLTENGDTSKVYILNGQIYAWIYKESTGPSYKNWMLYATDTDRTTIIDGKGYRDNYRLNSSGVEKSLTGCQVSGYIPVKKGDVIRIKNLEPSKATTAYTHVVPFYNSSNTQVVATSIANSTDGAFALTGSPAGVVVTQSGDSKLITINTSQLTGDLSTCNAFRFMGSNMANVIVTVNEEITEGGSTGGYGWYTTGYTFVPANYEDRIIAIERAIENGDIGGRLAIANIVESTEDGGENIITFSDGRTLTVKNGRAGSKGQAGIDGQNGTTQVEPLFAESVSWLNSNGNTSKLYILPDNYVYAYTNGAWKSTGNAFISTDGSCQKYLNDRNTYIYPVPSGYCESKVEYNATATHYLTKYDFATMTGMFTALATSNPNYVVETTLGKDATGTYDIKSYVLDTPSAISDGYESAMGRSKPTFIITSGLHGVEPDAVHMVYHFMKDLCENHMESDQLEYLRNNVRFVIVPLSNPWGYVNKSYNNSNDVDLNKNFEHGYRTNGTANTGAKAYSEAEAVLLKGVFDAYPNAVFHLECHGKYGYDTAIANTIWFSLMRSLNSDLIELCAEKITSQIGRRLYKLGHNANKSVGGYITYYGTNGRPKDYTGTEYGMLSATMEGTGKIYGTSGYSVNTQKVNCEALENFILRVLDSLNSRVEI